MKSEPPPPHTHSHSQHSLSSLHSLHAVPHLYFPSNPLLLSSPHLLTTDPPYLAIVPYLYFAFSNILVLCLYYSSQPSPLSTLFKLLFSPTINFSNILHFTLLPNFPQPIYPYSSLLISHLIFSYYYLISPLFTLHIIVCSL